jgi:stage II sporulation protein R
LKSINKNRLLILITILTFIFALIISYAKTAGSDISNSVLRLHIVANSNSQADQQLKLDIRDRIVNEASYLFATANSPDEAIKIAERNLDKIITIANSEIKKQGFSYTASAKIGDFAFPTKTYGDIRLPSGKYKALRIELGAAQGENWWCVMYPPLCFADGILVAPETAKSQLKKSLSEDEYNLITKSSAGKVPVEIRFKIVEIIQSLF